MQVTSHLFPSYAENICGVIPLNVEFFYDFSCPYAYLASTQIERVCAQHDAEMILKPMLLGGIFRHW